MLLKQKHRYMCLYLKSGENNLLDKMPHAECRIKYPSIKWNSKFSMAIGNGDDVFSKHVDLQVEKF